ncbi:MAG: TIGR00300 family protein [Deltaproteobacteria bacterium]|nr:TIGR00300 family protein [Deltaproteobacteria bacterium]
MGKASGIIELRGHIIDSLTFPKILDEILDHGAEYETEEITIGKTRRDASYARIRVTAPSEKELDRVIGHVRRLGAEVVEERDAGLAPAPGNGVFPEGFYATTNLPTRVRHGGRWLDVEQLCMDSAIRIPAGGERPHCVKMYDVRAGDPIIVGHDGVRVEPQRKDPLRRGLFEFMSSTVSPEKSKERVVRDIAREMKEARRSGSGKILWVLGPAVVHTGARESFCRIIDAGYVNAVFSGNGLAAHDIEASLYGTSLGVSLAAGKVVPRGHEHHLRAINTVRSLGGIARAVEAGLLKEGIMYRLTRDRIPFVLSGSVRDDGPLPEVITDSVEAQRRMRELSRDVTIAVMVATMLHSIATGNLLPATVRTVCVDINTEMVTKLADRGSHPSLGLVTDAEPFLRELAARLLE